MPTSEQITLVLIILGIIGTIGGILYIISLTIKIIKFLIVKLRKSKTTTQEVKSLSPQTTRANALSSSLEFQTYEPIQEDPFKDVLSKMSKKDRELLNKNLNTEVK